MNNNRCISCNCKFHPKKHIANQKYCAKRYCQNTRRRKWMRHKLRHDEDYRANQKEAQRRWKTNNPNYWTNYKKNLLAGDVANKKISKQKIKTNKPTPKKPILKILVTRKDLVNLCKVKSINYDCRLIVLP